MKAREAILESQHASKAGWPNQPGKGWQTHRVSVRWPLGTKERNRFCARGWQVFEDEAVERGVKDGENWGGRESKKERMGSWFCQIAEHNAESERSNNITWLSTFLHQGLDQEPSSQKLGKKLCNSCRTNGGSAYRMEMKWELHSDFPKEVLKPSNCNLSPRFAKKEEKCSYLPYTLISPT